MEGSGGGRTCFVLKKEKKEKIFIRVTARGGQHSADLGSSSALPLSDAGGFTSRPCGFESRFPLQQNSVSTKGRLGCFSPALAWEARGGGPDSRRRVTHALAHACPSARLPAPSVAPWTSQEDMAGNEDAVQDTEAVTSFSLKCLKEGAGRWPGSSNRPRPRQATCQRAPHGTLVQTRLQNPDVLPSPRPAPWSRRPPPTSQLARPGWGPTWTNAFRGHQAPWPQGLRGQTRSPGRWGRRGYTFHKVLALTPAPRKAVRRRRGGMGVG